MTKACPVTVSCAQMERLAPIIEAASAKSAANWKRKARSRIMAEIKIEKSWKQKLEGEFGQNYFTKLTKFVKDEYKKGAVYPAPKDIFKAFELTPFNEVKVVIIGQDPYHGKGQAQGLSFSVPE